MSPLFTETLYVQVMCVHVTGYYSLFTAQKSKINIAHYQV